MGQFGVVGQNGDGHVVAGLVDGLLDGLQNGIVSGVGEAVVAAHHHPVAASAHLIVDRQAVVGHAVDGIVPLDHAPAIVPQFLPGVLGEGEGGGEVGEQLLLGGGGVGAAAEVGVHRLVQQLRGEQAGVALGPGEDHGLAGGHGLQGRPRHAHK